LPRFPFMPREEKFFDLFERSAHNMVQAARELKAMVHTWENIPEGAAAITELEHEGDTITHQIIAQLHRSFITPFDREDIALMAHALDDVIDFIDAAADSMLIYRIGKPSERALELADIITQAAIEVEKAMPRLRRSGAELRAVLENCVEINRLENMADKVYRSALAELFDNATDMAGIIKWREIYEQMESATDRCEDVADVLEGVALKHA
jgi:predicted phosphate transport protein (TIGR00153 family)